MKVVDLDKEKMKRKDILSPSLVAEALREDISSKEIDTVITIVVEKNGETTLTYSSNDRLKVIGIMEMIKQEACLTGIDNL
ncbi:hypothetical protein [Paenibacillus antibioticophila]|uniref:hypothetical protein n=1 Tax=Paenibacillus antibioticophila TaxID=1274374 RepID=UPI0005C97DEB|nr:hypothetical protein [Paenibacillus antibioticophila]